MEDSHTEILSLKEDKGTAFFGVYDGHGGRFLSAINCLFKVQRQVTFLYLKRFEKICLLLYCDCHGNIKFCK